MMVLFTRLNKILLKRVFFYNKMILVFPNWTIVYHLNAPHPLILDVGQKGGFNLYVDAVTLLFQIIYYGIERPSSSSSEIIENIKNVRTVKKCGDAIELD